jgi:hypothetical protein
MDDLLCRDFFAKPQGTHHRRYEALRAFFLERRPLDEIAEQFGYKAGALRSMICRFRAACREDRLPPFSPRSHEDDPPINGALATSTARTRPPSPIDGHWR